MMKDWTGEAASCGSKLKTMFWAPQGLRAAYIERRYTSTGFNDSLRCGSGWTKEPIPFQNIPKLKIHRLAGADVKGGTHVHLCQLVDIDNVGHPIVTFGSLLDSQDSRMKLQSQV